MKFSVLTPSFNSGQYMERAIQSVLSQNYTNWEHIVVDGASTDNTVEILKKYGHLNWISEPDSGQSDAMNKAFEKATGQIIIYLNADDEMKPGTLQKFKDAFRNKPNSDMVVANLEVNHSGKRSLISPMIGLRHILNYWPCIFPANPVSYAYKKELQKQIGSFPVNNHYSMDYWFLLRAFMNAHIAKEDFVAGTFHFDGTNKSADADNARKWLKQVRDQFIRRYFYHPEVAKFCIKKLIKY